MEKILEVMPRMKMSRKSWIIIAVVAVILFRGPIANLLITIFNDILLLMWNISGWLDKLLFGVNPQ